MHTPFGQDQSMLAICGYLRMHLRFNKVPRRLNGKRKSQYQPFRAMWLQKWIVQLVKCSKLQQQVSFGCARTSYSSQKVAWRCCIRRISASPSKRHKVCNQNLVDINRGIEALSRGVPDITHLKHPEPDSFENNRTPHRTTTTLSHHV